MAQVRTHYDNLKIARNAPPEVIRAAYKTLSQKFHPDRNPSSPEAARIMQIINAAYDVLSDPKRRQEHDLWIRHQEQQTGATQQPNDLPDAEFDLPPKPVHAVDDKSFSGRAKVATHIWKYWPIYGICVLLLWPWMLPDSSKPSPGPKPYVANPTQSSTIPIYVRPAAAPNGQPWPTQAAYVQGYERLNSKGLSTVTVDNSHNDSDVFVKLVSLDSAEAYPVRTFFIPAFNAFTLRRVSVGSYDIRYRDLSSGELSRTESFEVEEIPLERETRYSSIEMTLYKVQNGNMHTFRLDESEF